MNPNTPATNEPEATATTPAPATTPTPAVATKPAFAVGSDNSKKKLILIIAGAVVVVLLASIAAFALWYNKPENVVSDSFMKVLTAKTSEGSVSAVMEEAGTKTSVVASYAQNQNNEAAGSASVDMSGGEGPAYKLSGKFAVDKEQTVYVKVDNVRKALEAMVGSDPSAAMYLEMFEGVITSVEGKWISVSQKDLQELSGNESEDKELTCVQGKVTEFQKSKSQQNELQNLYNKNQFIKVAQKGTETVEGVYSNHYVLTADEAKAKEFSKGVKSLTVFKNIDGCMAEDLAKQVDENINEKADDSTKSSSTVNYWVGVWSHEPVKVVVNSTEGEQKTTLEFKPKLNTNPSVSIPKADKSIKELQQELVTSTEALYGPMPLDDL